jgi:hypothetical protein
MRGQRIGDYTVKSFILWKKKRQEKRRKEKRFRGNLRVSVGAKFGRDADPAGDEKIVTGCCLGAWYLGPMKYEYLHYLSNMYNAHL